MDETDLNIQSRKIIIDYTSITECNDTLFKLPGLKCGDQCLHPRHWCKRGRGGLSCGKYNFGTANKHLCANTTFWKGKTCDMFFTNGKKAAVGRRCTGATQHCLYPWYTSSIINYEVSVLVNQEIIKRLFLCNVRG